jgi:hypothetical protein
MPYRINYSKYPVVGAGGYGIVVRSSESEVLKLFNTDLDSILQEAYLHTSVYDIIDKNISDVGVPPLYSTYQDYCTFNSKTLHYGIEMLYLEPPANYTEQVHMILGYNGDDLNESWGVRTSEPVSSENLTRGYFASPETLEKIWSQEGSDMTIEKLAFLMGRTNRALLDHGVLPIDIEWVWSKGYPYIIDFGLCRFGKKDPFEFLETKGLVGLASDLYIPHRGDRGYEEFMLGFSQST